MTKLEAASHPRTIGRCDKTLWSLQCLLSRSVSQLRSPSDGRQLSEKESLLACSSLTLGSMFPSFPAAQGISR